MSGFLIRFRIVLSIKGGTSNHESCSNLRSEAWMDWCQRFNC